MVLGIVRPQRERPVEIDKRLRRAAHLGEQRATVAVGVGERRIDLDGAAESLQRVVVLVLPQMRLALEVVQPRLLGIKIDRALDHLDTFAELPLLQRQHGDVIERVDVAGVLLQHRHIAFHGGLMVAGPMQRERLLEGRLLAVRGRGRIHGGFMPQRAREGNPTSFFFSLSP